MNEKELLKVKEKIDEAKSKVSELKGRKQYLMQELKDTWDCTSLEKARDKLKEMETQIIALNEQIEKGTRQIEEKYDV